MTAKALESALRRELALLAGTRRLFASAASRSASQSSATSQKAQQSAQQSAHAYYRRQRENTLWFRLFGKPSSSSSSSTSASTITLSQRNINTAWYVAAVVIGALGATYAAVPLYKVFCQTTGFGGTTQRVRVGEQDAAQEGVVERWMREALGRVVPPSSGARVHTWTDEEAAAKLASLKPVENADLLTVRFDTTVDDIMPWSFVPVQLDVKVVPGETALSFFRVTNRSDKAITGVATYNVHPPKVGLYFQKIQCFCFEEQRLLPGETVDMPVFFFIDPDIVKDPQVSYVRSITLSYFFHQTDIDDEDDDEDDDDEDDDDDDEEKEKEA